MAHNFNVMIGLGKYWLCYLGIITGLMSSQTVNAQQGTGLLLNEIMASNAHTIDDEDGDYEDWIELYNANSSAINLEGFGLSDNYNQPFKWVFPEIELGAGEYLLIWASGKDRNNPESELHTNFSIAADGEEILLTYPDGTLLDSLPPTRIPTDISIGRKPDGGLEWYFFSTPTPGYRNSDTAYQGESPPSEWSHPAGFYSEPIELTISHPDSQARIYFTTDGSTPTSSSRLFSDTLVIADRSSEPNIFSMIRTNNIMPEENARRAWYPPSDVIRKATTIRTKTIIPGHLPTYETNTFFVYPEGPQTFGIPVFSLVTDADNLFDDEIGIYVPGNTFVPGDFETGNYQQRGIEWERPVSMELFIDGETVLKQNAGVRIHGNWTRRLPLKGLRLYARNQYGDSHFRYPLFTNRPHEEYRRVILRASGNDWRHTFFRDAAAHELARNMDFDTQAYRPSIVFINGEYWGLTNIRERIDVNYIEKVYGIDPDNIDMLRQSRTVVLGDRAHYNALFDLVTEREMTDPADLAEAVTYFDLNSFLDLYAFQIYCANNDWPNNNQVFWRTRTEHDPYASPGHDGRFRWMMFDADRCLGYSTSWDFDMIDYLDRDRRSSALIVGLLKNPEFRIDFINRINDHLNTTFVQDRVIQIVDSLKAGIEPYMPEHISRWGQPESMNDWDSNVEIMREFAELRPGYLREMLDYHFDTGHLTDIEFDVNYAHKGYIKINSIPIINTQPGVPEQPYPWSGTYFSAIPITIKAKEKPGYQFVGWSGDIDSEEPVITITPTQPKSINALFEIRKEEPVRELIHMWDFNQLPLGVLSDVLSDYSRFGSALITYSGDGEGFMDREENGTMQNIRRTDEAGFALRVRNPSNERELIFHTPSNGFQNVTFSYAVNRTNNGAHRQALYYRVDPDSDWIRVGDPYSIEAIADDFQVHRVVINDTDAFDNPDLMFRIMFGGVNASGSSGNNRFDNIKLTGVRIPGSTLPPGLNEPISFTPIIFGEDAHRIDLNNHFSNIENGNIFFEANSSNPSNVEVNLAGTELSLSSLRTGDATITITASDGMNPPVISRFQVIVYPEAHRIADGPYQFFNFDPDGPEYTYPANMIFLQSNASDPAVDADLQYAYHIPTDDYAEEDMPAGFPYNNTSRTRINGLGNEGIGFINTGRGRDVGGALLVLNTENVNQVYVQWLAGTVMVNDRTYGLRLQYRTDVNEPFKDVLDDGNPLVYISSVADGHTEEFGPVALPAELLNQPNLQLLWRYYSISGSGSRPKIRLDNILVQKNLLGEGEFGVPRSLMLSTIFPNPFNTSTNIRFGLPENGFVKLRVYNPAGQLVAILKDEEMTAGYHQVEFNGSNLSSGVYFIRVQMNGDQRVRAMTLIK